MSDDYFLKPSVVRYGDSIEVQVVRFRPPWHKEEEGEISIVGWPISHQGGSPPWYVREPDWLDRLFGITFDDNLEKAKRKAQAFCDKRNNDLTLTRARFFKIEREK